MTLVCCHHPSSGDYLCLSIAVAACADVHQRLLLPCRNLTYLRISSKHIAVLPPLPPQLKDLHLKGCSKLRSLPALPASLCTLISEDCSALKVPSSFNASAVTVFHCINCPQIKSLPKLPLSLTELKVNSRTLSFHGSFQLLPLPGQLPALPEGLTSLDMSGCIMLAEVRTSCWTVSMYLIKEYPASPFVYRAKTTVLPTAVQHR